ncbi:MAG: REJ domain-containing protein [Pseudomonadota bacterium]|nr:REJ domain-containing protein [Pseudomonadota bacterium]
MRSTLFYRYLYATLKETCDRRFTLAGKSLHMLWAAFALSAFTTSALAADLVNGGYVEGEIAIAQEIDTWTFDGISGDLVAIQVADESQNQFAPWVKIFNPDGSLLSQTSSNGVAHLNNLTLGQSGEYTVSVQDASIAYSNGYDDTGDYRIYFVKPPVNEHGMLINGSFVDETIEYGDIDTWQFEGSAGEEVTLHITDESGTDFAPYVQIYSPSGAFLNSISALGVARFDRLELTESGNYTVVVQDAAMAYSNGYDDSGDYRIYFVKPPVNEHGMLINGSFVDETIEYGDIDTWQFEGSAGEEVTLHITDESDTEFAPYVQIYSPSGVFISSQASLGVARFDRLELTESGNYTVVVQDANVAYSNGYDDTGDYRIYFVKPPVNEHGMLINGSFVDETIEYGDIDTWQFEGSAGEEVILHITDESDTEFAPYVQIYSPSGVFINSQASLGVARFDRLELTESGNYTVVVQDANVAYSNGYDDTGDYRIYFVKPPVSEHGALVSNGYVGDTIEFGDLDTWHFDASSGDTISVEILDTDLDALAPFGQLYDPDGEFLNGFTNNDVAILSDYTVLKSGTYTLVVQDAAIAYSSGHDDTGPYQIGFNLEPGAPQPVPPSASISTNGNVYRFDTISLDGSGSTDPDNAPAPLTYYWAITEIPADSDLVLNMLDNVTGDSASIVPDVSGEYVFSLTVDDGLFTDSTEVTVTVMNRAPVAEAGTDGEFATGSVVTLDGSNSYDPEGDTLTYSWSFISKPSGSYAGIDSSASVITSFTADIEGTYVIALVVNDGETDSVADTVTLTVVNENVAPVALSSLPLEVLVGETIVLYGNDSYDPDNGPSPLSYAWSFGSIPADSGLTDADITNPSLATASFVPDVDGNFTVWLTVNDGELENSIAATTLVGALPVCSLNSEAGFDTTAGPGEVVQLDGTGSTYTSACDELSVNWQFVSVPSGSVLNNNDIASSGTLAASFMPDTSGAYVLRLTLVNGQISSADNVTVTVVANESPVAIAGADQTHDVQSNIVLDGSASYDPDASPAPLTYLWQVVSQPAGSNIQVTTPTAPVAGFFALLPGDYVLSLTVSDGSASDTDEILITIEAEEPLMCDINGDNVVDTTDIMKIFARRNTQANGPDDPADLNGDGVINVLDARGCVLQCTFTNCAVQPPQ